MISTILPATLFSLRHLGWLAPSALVLGGLTMMPIVTGVIGIRRDAELETRPYRLPAFVRRLEDESRLKYEMDLLARMQLGLLPQRTPQIEGYDIAACSILATEAGGDLYDFVRDDRGRLWIAAGDVSGHGYSCAIAQAMTKAGLASLVESDRTPADVLERLDRVLRGISTPRTFTTLSLMRLDPKTGDILASNAGHPFPLLARDGVAYEVELPSLPLGQGPLRRYENAPLILERGGVIVFLSDGLFEAMNDEGHAYGFERVRVLLGSLNGATANAILDGIVADWRRHNGPAPPEDDTTLVVVRRV